MKLNVYMSYKDLVGSIETTKGSELKVNASKQHHKEFIQGLAVHSAQRLMEANGGKMPSGEEVLKDIARRMPDGKMCWAEEVKGTSPQAKEVK